MQAEDYFDSYEEAISIVKELWLKHGNLDQEVRLLGVSVSNLLNPETSAIQLTIHEGSVDEWLGSSN